MCNFTVYGKKSRLTLLEKIFYMLSLMHLQAWGSWYQVQHVAA